VRTIPAEVPVVCVAVGHRYPVKYVWKLESMLRRHMPVPFSLTCVVDRPRKLPDSVHVVDARGWGLRREGMRVTTDKLGLFEPGRLPFDEFLYLDTTLVIQRDMRSLLEFGFGRDEELVVLRDWNYDAYNTCIMRIRTGGALSEIPRAFREGVTYPWRNPGDQDYVTAYVRDKGLEDRIAIWPEEMVVSYKNAREVHRTEPAAAYRMLESGTIVKFYGKTKMDQLLNPLYRSFKMKGPDARFWVRQLAEHWR
jgi:hypothetical protein